MLRKRSDELPRYVKHGEPSSYQWPTIRRRTIAIVAVVLLYFIFFRGGSKSNKPDDEITIDWSKQAYSLYATDRDSMCHAVLIFEALQRLGSKADKVLFYPEYWDTTVESSKDRESQLLVIARDEYKVKLQPIKLLSVEGLRTPDQPKRTWDKSVTKFMAFSLTQYDRVIALDSDITLLQTLDELFLLPSTAMAMPRAYWNDDKPWPLTSLLMVLEPSLAELNKLKAQIEKGADSSLVQSSKYDMELLNDRFGDSALVLPHRPYALLSGEFRRHDHIPYLGSADETWDADVALKEAKLVHFSDWPLPKPWIMWPHEGLVEIQPDCGGSKEGTCRERVIWKDLYDSFRLRRKDICKILSVPAPDWAKIKAGSSGGNVTATE